MQQQRSSNSGRAGFFVERFAALRRAQPDAASILDADADRVVTRDVLAREADALAERLARSTTHAQKPAIVAIQLPNGAPLIAAVLACWQADLVPMPVDHDVAPAALAQLCRTVGASLVVRSGEVPDRPLAIEPLEHDAHALAPDTALLKVTSGSTGEPRAVALTSAALEVGVAQIVATMGLEPADRNLVTIPLAHSYAFDNVVLTLLRDGMPAVLSRDLTPRRLLAVARDARVTVLPTVPFLLDVLARSAHVGLPDLRLVISAGAPLPVAARERFAAAFGVRPRTFYGSTECGGIAFDREGTSEVPEGCVGTPLEGVRVVLEQPDEDGVGRVRVLSRSTATGYHPAGSGGGGVELGGGSFLTADLGALDGRGRLRLVGRVRDVVNVGGRKVCPVEVERVIRSVPGVRDAVVTGVARSPVADALHAVVAAERHVTRDAIVAACERHLARYKVPRTIDLVDEIPRTARGKLDRRALDGRHPIG